MSRLSGKRVLVTGADGFIGSHLVQRLIREGADVRAFCLYNSFGSRGWLEDLDPAEVDSVEVVLGDIRDAEFVRRVTAGRELVFHLAALIAIPYSYEAVRSYAETNIMGTINILESCRASAVERVIHTSTSEVYGTPSTLPILESHPLRGQSPYSATKIAADKLSEAYAFSYETPVVTLRPFNTYGPRQSARAIIPTLLRQLLAGVDEVRMGSLDPRRDFTYVADTVDGFVRMAVMPVDPGVTIQLGTGRAVSIGDLVEMCRQVVGSQAKIVIEPERLRPERSEVMVLESDPQLALQLLGWRPSTTLEQGLQMTADWLRSRVEHQDVTQYQR